MQKIQKSTARAVLLPLVLALSSLAMLELFAPASARGDVPTPAPSAKPPVRRTHLSRARIAHLSRELASDDPRHIADALDEIVALGPKAVRLSKDIEQLLTAGSRTDLVVRAIGALSVVGAPEASAAIRPYLKHRDPDVRRSAVDALVRVGGAVASEGLRAALSDPDPIVRARAAAGLGTLGASEAVVDLLRALERGVVEAAPAIGTTCPPALCEKFVALVGSIPFDAWTSGFEPLVRRSDDEITEDARVRWIGRLRSIETVDPRPFVAKLLAAWPPDGSSRVRAALESAVGGAR
jgi:hypothetical protein